MAADFETGMNEVPRTRGDRPEAEKGRRFQEQVPPYARG